MEKKNIFVAIDTNNLEEAMNIAKEVNEIAYGVKLGLEFFALNSLKKVKLFSDLGLKIFVDKKLFDIKTTCLKTIKAMDGLPIDYLTIHTMCGKQTLIESKKIASNLSKPIKLLGVTVLTSFNEIALKETGVDNSIEKQIEKLSTLAKETNLDGIICDGKNLKKVKSIFKGKIFVPGVRLDQTKIHDQDKDRSVTPKQAISNGASFVICGREVTIGNVKENILKIANSLN